MAKKAPKFTVDFSEEERARILACAGRNHQTDTEYSRNVILGSVMMAEQMEAQTRVFEKAFDSIEEPDPQPAGIMPLPPARKPIPGVLTEAERTNSRQRTSAPQPATAARVPPGPHPCVHLNPRAPRNLEGQCMGTCTHSSQDGRACFWAPATASNCSIFQARIVRNVTTESR